MDNETVKQSAEILFNGVNREWFLALLFIGGAFVIALSWWLQRPMVKVQESLDKVLDRFKTPEEIEDMVENIVLKHNVSCEGKSIMPRVLNSLDKNTQVIQEHSHANHALTESVHALTDAVHTLKQRSV